MSCYAPTRGSVKDVFWNGLEFFLDSVRLGEQWIVLGDINSRISSRGYCEKIVWLYRELMMLV